MDYTLEILKYVGKFHPLVLHLPIGALLMTFLLVLVSRYQKVSLEKAIRVGVDFSLAGALLATVLGYFLSLDTAYDFQTLKFHFWAGIVTLILSFSLSVLHRMKEKNNLFLGAFVVTLLALSVTGHKGAQITHGEEYLSTASLFEKPKIMVQKDSIDYYNEVVHAIFEDKCISCHNATKSKSDLRLDRYDLVLKGGERGSMFDIDNKEKGRLLTYIHLPLDDKLHMPPKNKTQLTEEEQWLLTHWVTSGTYLKEGSMSLVENDTLKSKVLSFLGVGKQVEPANQSDLAKLMASGFRIRPNALHDNLLKVKFMKKQLTEDDIDDLLKVKNQIIELDLSHTNFNDKMASVLTDFPRIRVLRLDQTKISDAAMASITNLSLEVLNVCRTNVSRQGLMSLLEKSKPKTIYAWNTSVDQKEQKQLASIAPALFNFGTSELFSEKLSLSAPKILNSNTIFKDSVMIEFDQPKVKNIKIHYTLDGSEPDENAAVYQTPIMLKSSSMLKAKSIKEGWNDSEVFEQMIFENKNHILNYQVNNKLDRSFSISHHVDFTFEDNQAIIFDGKKGERVYRGTSIEHAKTWLGVVEQDLEVEVKLNEPEKINYVTLSLLENQDMKTIFPKKIKVFGKSPDGKYVLLNSLSIPVQKQPDERVSYFRDFTLEVDLKNHKDVKVVAVNHMKFPDAPVYRKQKNRNSWIFMDELIFW